MYNTLSHRTGLIDREAIMQEFEEAKKQVIAEFGLEIRVHTLTGGFSEKKLIAIAELEKDNAAQVKQREILREHNTIRLVELLQRLREAEKYDKELATSLQKEIDHEVARLATGNEASEGSLQNNSSQLSPGNDNPASTPNS